MMYKPSNEKIELLYKIGPWLVPSDTEGKPAQLKSDAPEEIQKLYQEWLKTE